MDDTEFYENGIKMWIHNIRDLGAQYVMEPLATQGILNGKSVARNLESLFRQQGPPLFLKRDGGSNLCCTEVDEVLAKWMVLPVTSPPNYPRYNGAIEWSQGQLKSEISRIIYEINCNASSIVTEVKPASYRINHRSCPSLQGRFPCHAIATSRIQYNRNERRHIQRWIEDTQKIILDKNSPKVDERAAWRQAVTRWLTNNGLLIIKEAKKVLPNFGEESCA